MPAFHVGFPPHILVLAQVVPGYDGHVAHAMATHFARESEHEPQSDPSDFIYFAFSEYDVLAIVPLSEEGQLDRLTTFGHEYVRDLQQILCFPWVSGSEIAGDLQPAPALTLTFLKLDEELIAKEGLGVEHDAVHSLQRWIHKGGRSGALNGLVLGSLGWPELLLMLTGSDLGELLNVARDLATTPIQRRNKPDLRFTFSHTLPCVRWAGNGKRFATESVDGQVSCQVLVSARPEHLGQVIRTVRDLPHSVSVEGAHDATVPLWDTEVAFGRRDLLVTPRDRHPVSIDVSSQ